MVQLTYSGICYFVLVMFSMEVLSKKASKKIDASMSDETRLWRTLMSDYEKDTRPVKNSSKPVTVFVTFNLLQLEGLVEKSQIMNSFGWLFMRWTDEYLQWNKDDYGGLDNMVVDTDKIWRPDCVFQNSAGKLYNDLFSPKFQSSIFYSGEIILVGGGRLTTSCALDMTYFPFDRQTCWLEVASWAYGGKHVRLENGSSEIDLSLYNENGQWLILETSSRRDVVDTGEATFDMIIMTVELQRKPIFYLLNVIVPCTVLSLMSLLMFYLPPESGEKVSLGITCLLSFSVFQFVIADKIPETSDYIPVLTIYLMCIMCVTALSLIFTVVVLNLHHHSAATSMSRIGKFITFKLLAPLVGLRKEAKALMGIKSPKQCQASSSHINPRGGFNSDSPMIPRSRPRSTQMYEPVENNGRGTTVYDVEFNEARRPANGWASKRIDRVDEDDHQNAEEDKCDNGKLWLLAARILDRLFLRIFFLIDLALLLTILCISIE